VLRGSDKNSALQRPHVILLDLNMPTMNGFEFLNEVRADPTLNDSVVFVFTTSNREADRLAAYRKNVAGYVSKAAVGEDCIDLVRMIDSYWRVVELPA
jgi:CheY-like chemotaxis protein